LPCDAERENDMVVLTGIERVLVSDMERLLLRVPLIAVDCDSVRERDKESESVAVLRCGDSDDVRVVTFVAVSETDPDTEIDLDLDTVLVRKVDKVRVRVEDTLIVSDIPRLNRSNDKVRVCVGETLSLKRSEADRDIDVVPLFVDDRS